MNPRITVLLPTHDRPDVLSFAIESVLWQTEEDFELLVVGDGCTDATRDVVRRFSDRRIRWFDLPKGPLSGYNNRNAALQEARGHYIAYGQDDDIFLPDHLARLAAELDATGSEWGYCRTLWCVPKGYLLPVLVNLTNPDELDWFINTG
ncbi:MAG: glycosyltransferase family 2 protein, partial [Rhizobiales bacterium]|nr:glycosyltransferase family 2 protein [Hyphomicrobiales bacterium]